jgi:hypothetical protein
MWDPPVRQVSTLPVTGEDRIDSGGHPGSDGQGVAVSLDWLIEDDFCDLASLLYWRKRLTT